MQTKIAVICSTSFKERLTALIPTSSPFLLDYYTYTIPEETPSLLKKVTSCDAIFISGTLPYLYAKDALTQISIPWIYLKQDETSITTTLLALFVKQPISLNRLSIDVMDHYFIEHVLQDFQTDVRPFIQTIDLYTPYEHYISQHEQLWQQQKVDYIITSIHTVYDALVVKNIPVMRMIDPQSSILRSLYEVKNLSDYAKSDSAKVAVTLFHFEEKPEDTLLEEIATLLSSFYQKMDVLNYEFYTTSGHIKTHHLSLLTLLGKTAFRGGFGYGHSITEAKNHAKQALSFAQLHQLILVDEKKRLHELHLETSPAVALQTTNPLVFEITQATGLSPKNISRIIAFEQVHPHASFSAQDLADYLHVTRRTTERILKKLLTHQYVKIIGEEMTYQQGRPRAVYILNFAAHL